MDTGFSSGDGKNMAMLPPGFSHCALRFQTASSAVNSLPLAGALFHQLAPLRRWKMRVVSSVNSQLSASQPPNSLVCPRWEAVISVSPVPAGPLVQSITSRASLLIEICQPNRSHWVAASNAEVSLWGNAVAVPPYLGLSGDTVAGVVVDFVVVVVGDLVVVVAVGSDVHENKRTVAKKMDPTAHVSLNFISFFLSYLLNLVSLPIQPGLDIIVFQVNIRTNTSFGEIKKLASKQLNRQVIAHKQVPSYEHS